MKRKPIRDVVPSESRGQPRDEDGTEDVLVTSRYGIRKGARGRRRPNWSAWQGTATSLRRCHTVAKALSGHIAWNGCTPPIETSGKTGEDVEGTKRRLLDSMERKVQKGHASSEARSKAQVWSQACPTSAQVGNGYTSSKKLSVVEQHRA